MTRLRTAIAEAFGELLGEHPDFADHRTPPWRSSDLRDPMLPIGTRLPAGLPESLLLDGYAVPAAAPRALPAASTARPRRRARA